MVSSKKRIPIGGVSLLIGSFWKILPHLEIVSLAPLLWFTIWHSPIERHFNIRVHPLQWLCKCVEYFENDIEIAWPSGSPFSHPCRGWRGHLFGESWRNVTFIQNSLGPFRPRMESICLCVRGLLQPTLSFISVSFLGITHKVLTYPKHWQLRVRSLTQRSIESVR